MELKFGTAGIRGVMGPAPGQMNTDTVRLASLGLAKVLRSAESSANRSGANSSGSDPARKPLVLISRDSRNGSYIFALETARTLQMKGIRAIMFEEMMPVPVLSFAVRRLKANAGVMITASHNPKEYNGYKVYNARGCQLVPKEAEAVQDAIASISEESFAAFKEELSRPENAKFSVDCLSSKIVEEYYEAMSAASDIKGTQRSKAGNGLPPLKVLYTPLNGSGLALASRRLAEDGYDLHLVGDQTKPDGNFTTCGQPNPELLSAFASALELAKDLQPDIIVATDPDCDRVGAMVRSLKDSGQNSGPKGSDSNGLVQSASEDKAPYRLLSGNDLGVLVLSYLCENGKMQGKTFISSFVSTPLADRMAEHYGMQVEKTPVGFKHIAAKMDQLGEDFGFAFEESNGMILGLYTRDKDGVLGARLICKAADWCRQKGTDVLSQLAVLNEQFGPVYARTVDLLLDPSAPKPDTKVSDLPDGSRIVVRPSGTEPKLKYYFFAPSQERLDELIQETIQQ